MLIEALIAILIFSIGILAVVGMQGMAIKSVTDSKYRSEAAFLANELLAKMWTDQGNIALYHYPGSGTVPLKLADWVERVNGASGKLPGAVNPNVLVPAPGTPAATAAGATVQIEIFWRLPEEATLGLPPHRHTVIASIFM
jgi:type IV pilus assembly protein PilV